MKIKNVAVIGAGTMGHGITQVFAQNNYPVLLIDINEEILNKALSKIQKSLSVGVEKGKITEDMMQTAVKNIKISTDLEDAKNSQLVIEAASENLDIKLKIFKGLDKVTADDAILATNTSSISITQLAGSVKNPHRVIGMHFMNPVPIMKLVEIISGISTSEEVLAVIIELTKKLGKTPACANDYPGFISNRILMPMINEAVYALMEGVGKKEDIDTVMKLGMNHPLGPLELADLIGLDVCLSIMEILYRDFADSKYRPCPLLRKMVKAGYTGRKTGRGFYEYKI